MRRAAKPPAPLSPYTVTDSPVARAKRSATSCPFFPPPLIDVVPVDIYRCAAWRANDEGRVVPPSVPISGRSVSSAASRQQSLSSYPAGRSQLSYFHRYRSTHHSKFAPVPSMEPRSWHILLYLRPLQGERLGERCLVIGIQIHQLLHFFGRSRQQERPIRLFVGRVDAFFVDSGAQPTRAQKRHLHRVLPKFHPRDRMPAEKMHAMKLIFSVVVLGKEVDKPRAAQSQQMGFELARRLLVSLSFLHDQRVLLLLSLLEREAHIPFLVPPAAGQSRVGLQIHFRIERAQGHHEGIS